jgi:hypothetical protein
MGLVVVVALCFGIADAVRLRLRAAEYRRRADMCEQMERRCREIDAMDPVTRSREAEAAWDDPYLSDPAMNRQMISYYEKWKGILRQAAENPRAPLPRERERPFQPLILRETEPPRQTAPTRP